jgi:hypothetical protein
MLPTTETTNELKMHIEQSFKLLKTLRDEARVELHLAGMEAKDRWAALELRFHRAEQLARDVETAHAYRLFRDTLKMDRIDIKPDDDDA